MEELTQGVVQESTEPTRGPRSTVEIISKIVRDIRNLCKMSSWAVSDSTDQWNEIKKLQNAPAGAGAGNDLPPLRNFNLCINGQPMTVQIPSTEPHPVA